MIGCDAVTCLHPATLRPGALAAPGRAWLCPDRATCAAARRGGEPWRHTTFIQPPWPEEPDDDD